MNARLARLGQVLEAIVHEAHVEKITFLAGSIAYHAFVSLLPLLLFILAAITAFGDQTLEAAFISLMQSVLAPGQTDATASDLFVTELRQASQSAGVSAFGLGVLLWGTLRIFRGIDTAFSDIYETESENTLLDQVGDGVVVLVVLVLAVVAAGVTQRYVPSDQGLAWWLLRRFLLVVGLTVVLYPMYYVFPDTDVSGVEVVPGTVFAATFLTAFESLFRFYTEFGGGSGSGIIASILVLLTWLYFSGLVLLMGVVINAVLSNRSADVNIDPVLGGVEPTAPSDRTDRAAVSEALTRLEETLRDATHLSVTVDGQTVSLPLPHSVETDTESDVFDVGTGDLGVTLRWSSANVGGDEDVVDDASESTSTARPRD